MAAFDAGDVGGPVGRLIGLRAAQDGLDRDLLEAVEAARQAGVPWEAIGVALGVTRQSVHRRFAALVSC